jgi:plastocyanin
LIQFAPGSVFNFVIRNRAVRAVAVVVLTIVAAACSSSSSKAASTTTPSGSSSGGAATITIKNFQFTGNLTVKTGARVTVHNADSTAHTVTASGGSFDTGQISAGSSASFTAPKPGRYPFHCNIHNYMTATLTVTG